MLFFSIYKKITKLSRKTVSEQCRQARADALPSWIDACRQYMLLVIIIIIIIIREGL